MLTPNLIRSCLAGTVAITALSACTFAEQTNTITMSVQKPDVIAFESSVADMESALKNKCSSLEIREIDPPRIPDVSSQTQIDCEGFGYFGAPRKAEFVFVNNALMLTWILVEAEEIPALEVAFSSLFGEPTSSKDTILAYAHNFAAVRNDTPEALYYSQTAAPFVIDRVNKLPDRD